MFLKLGFNSTAILDSNGHNDATLKRNSTFLMTYAGTYLWNYRSYAGTQKKLLFYTLGSQRNYL